MNAPTQSITIEFMLQHPPAKVWRALTEPKLLARWLMATDLRPEVGARFTFNQEPSAWWDGVVRCEVRISEPHQRLSYTWRGGPGENALDTVVTWTLTPTPSGGTRLTLEHAGFVPTNVFAFKGARAGWQRMVGETLPTVLEAL